jgi:hypothetical protein
LVSRPRIRALATPTPLLIALAVIRTHRHTIGKQPIDLDDVPGFGGMVASLDRSVLVELRAIVQSSPKSARNGA